MVTILHAALHKTARLGCATLPLAFASIAHAQDPCDALLPECSAVVDGQSLNRALSEDCEAICIAGALPIRSVPIRVDGTSLHTVHAGRHPIPAFSVQDGGSLTIVGGVAMQRYAVAGSDRLPAPVLLDVGADGALTLDGTVLTSAEPEAPASQQNHGYAVIRQDASSSSSSVTLKGIETSGAFHDLLVSQQASSVDGAPCTHAASLQITGADGGAPSVVELGSGGVIAASVCWREQDGPEGIDGSFAEGTGGATTIARLRLTGEAEPRSRLLDGVVYTWPAISSPGVISIEESLFDTLTVLDRAVMESETSVVLDNVLMADLTLHNAALVRAPEVAVEHSIACAVAPDGDDARGLFGLPSLSGGTGRLEQVSLEGVAVPLFDSADGARVSLNQVTARASDGEAYVATGGAFIELRNTYLEGNWSLPLVPAYDPETADGDQVHGLRLAETEAGCPSPFPDDCAVLEESALRPGVAECTNVLREGFDGWATLADWPVRLGTLSRLIPTQAQQPLLLAPGADPAAIDQCDDPAERPAAWDCSTPFLVGAWAGWECGLDMLDPCPLTERPEAADDTAAPSTDSGADAADTAGASPDATSESEADFGCAVQASALAVFLGPLAWAGRRRRRLPLSETHPGGVR